VAIPPAALGAHIGFIFFQDAGPRAAGWTTNFWNTASTLENALTAASLLAPLLQKVAGKQAILGWYTARIVYQPGIPSIRLVASKYLIKPGGPPNQLAEDADYPTTALLMELRATTGESVRETIRSLPDDATSKGGWYTPQQNTANDFKALFTELARAGSGWCLMTHDAAFKPKPIQGFSTSTGIVSCAGHGFDAGDVILIGGRGIGASPRVNGQWRVKDRNSANTFTLQGWKNTVIDQDLHLDSAYAMQKVMSAKAIAYDPAKQLSSQTSFITKRDVGRPKRVLTGRRTRGH
jgi:hypothetical protein